MEDRDKWRGRITEMLLVGCFGFYGISTFVGYLTPNPFSWKLFYFKQFSISTQFKSKYSLIVKNISISSYSV